MKVKGRKMNVIQLSRQTGLKSARQAKKVIHALVRIGGCLTGERPASES